MFAVKNSRSNKRIVLSVSSVKDMFWKFCHSLFKIVSHMSVTHKERLTVEALIREAKSFCDLMDKKPLSDLFGITDGKAIGT